MTPEVMRLPGVPTPYPDELLYSVFARAGRYLGITSPKSLTATLLGSRGALAVPDLPSRLSCVEPWARSEWGLSLEDIVLGHTAAPYYLHLRGRRAYRSAIAAMRGTGRHLQVRLGNLHVDRPRHGLLPVVPGLRPRGPAAPRGNLLASLPPAPGGPGLSGARDTAEHHDGSVPDAPRDTSLCPQRRLSSDPLKANGVFGPAALRIARDLAGRSAAWCDLAPEGDGTLVDYRPVLRRHGYLGERGAVMRLQRDLGAFVGDRLLGQILASRRRPGGMDCSRGSKAETPPAPSTAPAATAVHRTAAGARFS